MTSCHWSLPQQFTVSAFHAIYTEKNDPHTHTHTKGERFRDGWRDSDFFVENKKESKDERLKKAWQESDWKGKREREIPCQDIYSVSTHRPEKVLVVIGVH